MFGVKSDKTYICDPRKNTECNKNYCGILGDDPAKCLCTSKKKYAMYDTKVSVWDQDGNYILAMAGMKGDK